MSSLHDELFEIAERLEATRAKSEQPGIKEPLQKLENAASKAAKSWSGSWLGYHSRVYYENLQSPPPGARFSPEWVLTDMHFIDDTVGDWTEYDYDEVFRTIHEVAGNPDLGPAREFAKTALNTFEDGREEVVSLLTTTLEERDDPFISKLKEEAEKLKVYSVSDYVRYFCPSGQLMSRDSVAIHQGLQTPPHITVLADTMAMHEPGKRCEDLAKVAKRAGSHLAKRERHSRRNQEMGTNIFIGHGRSPVWRDLKDFVQDRLRLPYDEFNRVPVAGIPNIARLSQMLNDAAIAFLVMTAEDEQADGKMHARMNVVHEAGLFQGRLGFTRAIVLVEEGCEGFSNIEGLGQIRFPKDNISPAFEEIRRVLERERLIGS